LRIAIKALAQPYPGDGQELLVVLHWMRLGVAIARAALVCWMVGKLAKGAVATDAPVAQGSEDL
jgi:hypothetical protein